MCTHIIVTHLPSFALVLCKLFLHPGGYHGVVGDINIKEGMQKL